MEVGTSVGCVNKHFFVQLVVIGSRESAGTSQHAVSAEGPPPRDRMLHKLDKLVVSHIFNGRYFFCHCANQFKTNSENEEQSSLCTY